VAPFFVALLFKFLYVATLLYLAFKIGELSGFCLSEPDFRIKVFNLPLRAVTSLSPFEFF